MAWRHGASSGSKSVGSGSMHSMQSLRFVIILLICHELCLYWHFITFFICFSARSSVSSKLTPSNSTEKPRPFAMPREGMMNRLYIFDEKNLNLNSLVTFT